MPKPGQEPTETLDGASGDVEYLLGDQVGFFLRQANQRHVAIFTDLIGEKLTTTQWAALAKLKELQPCSQGNLGREIAVDMATIKGVVDRLVKRGLVRTEVDSADARRLVVNLTEDGEQTITRNRHAALDVSQETLRPLTLAERMMFMELLKKIC